MKPQQSRWVKWVLTESEREATAAPFTRGERRAAMIARRRAAGQVLTPDARRDDGRVEARAQV